MSEPGMLCLNSTAGNGATTANGATTTTNLTVDVLQELHDRLLAKPDPLAQWMRSKGFDPEEGCLLIVPESLRREVGIATPKYLKFSDLVRAAYLIRPPKEFNVTDWRL